jgi:GNAT superfamily N-acetyltransferase
MDTGTIPAVVTSVLREKVCCFDKDDTITVKPDREGVRVTYTGTGASCNAGDATRLECRLEFRSGQMWVVDLRVAACLRYHGIGRQLATAAEGIAMALGFQTLNVFPLVPAGHFWKKMGYTSHPRTARVVTKDLENHRRPISAGNHRILKSTVS